MSLSDCPARAIATPVLLFKFPPDCSCVPRQVMALAEGQPFCSPAGWQNIRQSHSRSALLARALQRTTCPCPIASLCLDPQRSLASSQVVRAPINHSASPCLCAFPPLIASCARSLAERRCPCNACLALRQTFTVSLPIFLL